MNKLEKIIGGILIATTLTVLVAYNSNKIVDLFKGSSIYHVMDRIGSEARSTSNFSVYHNPLK